MGPVFFVLFLLSAVASRKVHFLVDVSGHEDNTARILWGITGLIFLLLIPTAYFGIHWAMIVIFIILYIIQNLWRPVLISRFNAHSEEARSATILSIESQAKSFSTMFIAPLLGLAIDLAKAHEIGAGEFWPVGVMGTLIALIFFLTAKRNTHVS